jgi:hypothetical protein
VVDCQINLVCCCYLHYCIDGLVALYASRLLELPLYTTNSKRRSCESSSDPRSTSHWISDPRRLVPSGMLCACLLACLLVYMRAQALHTSPPSITSTALTDAAMSMCTDDCLFRLLLLLLSFPYSQRLTVRQVNKKTVKQAKVVAHFPRRKYAIKA